MVEIRAAISPSAATVNREGELCSLMAGWKPTPRKKRARQRGIFPLLTPPLEMLPLEYRYADGYAN
ncbi:MAG: hypothetical protein QGF68_16035, partial [Nitrospinota bacterium]|nr:hypothetical protein [Nitrospinota bacterium]